MTILSATGGIAQTNCFVIADEAAKQAVMFDAPNDTTGRLLDQVAGQGWDLVGLWFTHGHFDHVADHALVTRRFPGCKVMIHREDEPKLDGRVPIMFPLPFVIPTRKADAYVEDGQELRIGSIRVKVMHTPGHCAGQVAYYLPQEKHVVGGDLIIMNAIGRTDLPDSNWPEMCKSLRRVMELPDDTRLLPGHGQPTLLRHELQTNCFVREVLAQD